MNTMDHLHYEEILREILSSENFKHINFVVFEGPRDVKVQKTKFKKKNCFKRYLGIREAHLQQTLLRSRGFKIQLPVLNGTSLWSHYRHVSLCIFRGKTDSVLSNNISLLAWKMW